MAVGAEMDFATELRVKTRRSHGASDRLVNMTLPLVFVHRELYVLALVKFYRVYRTLESAVCAHAHSEPALQALHFPQLARAPAFERDLLFHSRKVDLAAVLAEWPADADDDAYAARIESAARTQPLLLLAYCQAMYFAILSGGQLLRPIIRTGLRIPSDCDDGLDIFNFDGIKDITAFKEEYINVLNSLELSRQQKDDVIEEKKKVFEFNNRLVSAIRNHAQFRSKAYMLVFYLAILAMFLVAVLLYFVLMR
mmetsp:Transcript_12501/g.31697  ORF Transcript_12501/g.31697 Transcript_12501/m.31697 type:complete len:253 (+) Transcript_12501:108-866(+)